MEITIKQVNSKADLKEFIFLPEKIHKAHPYWLHPLYMDEKKFFNQSKNPAFWHNPYILLLAYSNNKPVGRIMGIVPVEYNRKNNINTARFAYFECFENNRVFTQLLGAVENWAMQQGCKQLIGPMGFTDKEPQGFLMKGYNKSTMLVTNCSYPFMQQYIQQAGYTTHVQLCQYEVPITHELAERYKKFAALIQNRLNIRVIEFNSVKEVRPYIRAVFELINKTYQEIYGFTNITDEEMKEFAQRFLPLLNPRLIKIICDAAGNVIAFVVAMADFSNGLRKARGRILPTGWYHIWRSAKKSKRLVLLLGAIDPAMQHKGLDAILATRIFESAIQLGFTTIDSHIIMRDNYKMRREIERLDGFDLYKEYTIFKKIIA